VLHQAQKLETKIEERLAEQPSDSAEQPSDSSVKKGGIKGALMRLRSLNPGELKKRLGSSLKLGELKERLRSFKSRRSFKSGDTTSETSSFNVSDSQQRVCIMCCTRALYFLQHRGVEEKVT
jgi:hypothetical protein